MNGIHVMANEVTVLVDELGLQREYREVKRNAAVGERIKVVSANRSCYPVGEVGVCTRNNEFSDWSIDTTLRFPGSESTGFIDACRATYVVLEPTDTVIIDGKRYMTVERKANVGERVVIVAKAGMSEEAYENGDCGDVVVARFSNGAIDVMLNGKKQHVWPREYRVIEPIDTVVLTSDPQPDIFALIANLSTRLTAAERTLAELTAERCASGPVNAGLPSYVTERLQTKPKPLTRDDVIARAKEDVSDLRKFAGTKPPNAKGRSSFWPHVNVPTTYTPLDDVEYVVNREKRTVVALIKSRRCVSVRAKGIARCAPDDVFNTHIGRAIALRRALGLDVPTYYTNAPKPVEAKVGDIIEYNGQSTPTVVVERVVNVSGMVGKLRQIFGDKLTATALRTTKRHTFRIIDDSGEEVNA